VKCREAGVQGGRPLLASVALTLLAGCAALAGCAGSTSGAERGAAATPAAQLATPVRLPTGLPATGTAPRSAQPSPHPPPRPSVLPVAPGAGNLKQTTAFPRTTSTAFHNAMHDFWLAVTSGNASLALPAFFPETAYVQVKAIADPGADWRSRLWYDFTLDVKAAHALVGHQARLIKVIVPAQYAAWVSPGACYNSVGYWHVPGARVVYQQGGETRSFGIASLISWRGDWYLVHLGAVLRGGAYGEVDDPQAGPGIPGPPGGC
jgi:hypothetical protein